jgi:hypothetical protein
MTGNMSAPGSMLPVLLSGFLGGYPTGAQAAAESHRTGRLTKDEANRLLLFCSQAGPSFLFGMVALRFPEGKYAWMLWAVQILSALTVAMLAYKPNESKDIGVHLHAVTFSTAMQRAIRAMASVCGWVVIFGVILGYLSVLPLGKTGHALLAGILELSNGCMTLEAVENPRLRFLLAAVMLNFGGICVALQTASVAEGLDLRFYLLGKLTQTAIAVLYALAFLGHYGALTPILSVFLLFTMLNSRKRSSIPVKIGV